MNVKMFVGFVMFIAVFSSIGLANAGTNLYFDHTGWNFISIPIYPLGGSVSIRDIACASTEPASIGECTEVYFYNSTDQTWYHWDKNKPDSENTLTNISSGYGYWFYATKVGTTDTIEGTIIDPINDHAWGTMESGWNIMGWTYKDPLVSDSIPQIETKWGKEIVNVWNYDINSHTLISEYWPDNASAVFDGKNGYWDCVYDPADPTYCDDTTPPIMPWQTMPEEPVLSDGKRDPSGGNNETMFTFSITYTDANNDAPSSALVYIDGVPHSMTYVGPLSGGDKTPANYTESVIYDYSTKLQNGRHKYYFEFSDGTFDVRYPKESVIWGPWVMYFNFDLTSYMNATRAFYRVGG